MSAVTSSPLSLSAEWIPTLLQTSKEVRKKGEHGRRGDERKSGRRVGVYEALYKEHMGGQ